MIFSYLLIISGLNFDCSSESISHEVDEMYLKDQGKREELSISVKNQSDIIEEINAIDSMNEERIKSIIEDCSVPDSQYIGDDSFKKLITIVSHASLGVREDFESTVEKEFKSGSISNQQYSIFIDKIMIEKTGYQKFGTQLKFTDGKVEMLPVEDLDKTKKYRKEIGLMPLEEYFSMVESAYKKINRI